MLCSCNEHNHVDTLPIGKFWGKSVISQIFLKDGIIFCQNGREKKSHFDNIWGKIQIFFPKSPHDFPSAVHALKHTNE